jgi:hypothetical protein
MKLETKNKLFEAWAYCDWEDKSTEFMLQYMQDVSGCGLDSVINFMDKQSKNRQQWYNENPNWDKKYSPKPIN